jgi:hypothetical protein
MTKEEIAKTTAQQFAPPELGVLFESEDNVEPWVLKAMDEYAKQQAIAFAKYVIVDVYKMNSISGSPYVSEDQVYDHFQKKEQQNK